ncbi:unnamed protein product [Moneuplotes crassus]|uniref:Uncharacterized protein n=1 Tax=Euplotes crassus TaxID=5936 RepID=A0AAD2DAI0_EUPCR|nr:unnamed protein product [Moneuplotes crassus]
MKCFIPLNPHLTLKSLITLTPISLPLNLPIQPQNLQKIFKIHKNPENPSLTKT